MPSSVHPTVGGVHHIYRHVAWVEGSAMQLEDYFDVQGPDDIRIRGHRIGIETVLYEYIH